MSVVTSLTLHYFRCYDQLRLDTLKAGLIVLCGENGAGKTNILEAVSLLCPGRGLRGAKVIEIQQNSDRTPWVVAAKIAQKYQDVQLGTGLDPNSKPGSEKRTIRIDGQNAKSQAELSKYVSCVWLTPQMDRLFLDSSRERRKFLDRLIFSFDPGHAGRVTRYENALSQRSKLLREGVTEPAWLKGLEQQMAETGIAIAAARLDFAQRLQAACINSDSEHFPHAKLFVKGSVEGQLENMPALQAEDNFLAQLEQSRERDAITGGAQMGPHKSDLQIFYAEKNMAADQCSTGEQKALLIGLILAHARLIKAERGEPPVLLLDEVAAHLDDGRRAALYEILLDLGAQAWMTGTERSLFTAVENRAQFFEISEAKAMRV